MQHYPRREVLIDDKIAVHLQVYFYPLIIGKHIKTRLERDLTNGFPQVFDTYQRACVMAGSFAFLESIVGDGDACGVVDVRQAVGERIDRDREVLHRLEIETCRKGKAQRREGA